MLKRNKGFTLLGIIIVLALLGGVMAGVAHYAKKKADEAARHTLVNGIIREMNGLLKFVNEDEIAMKNGTTQTNPLYDRTMYNTLSYASSYEEVFFKRTSNHALEATTDKVNYLSWSGSDSKRSYFTNSRCDKGTDPTRGQVNRAFDTDYISCQESELSKNGYLKLDRVDFVGSSTDPLAIARVDFIVEYSAVLVNDNMRIELYKQAFDDSLKFFSLDFEDAVYLRRVKNSSNKNWDVITIQEPGKPDQLINFGTLATNSDKMGNLNSYDYAIRFSFLTGVGKNAKTDGSNGVDKLCWNINKQMTGPCLEAEDTDRLVINSGTGSRNKKPGLCWDSQKNKSLPCLSIADGTGVSGDDQLMQLTTEKNGEQVTGTLMANVIVENQGIDGKSELVTVPVVQYKSFTNGFNSAKKDNYTDGNVDAETGTLLIPVQKCPVAPGNRKMFPRLVAAISSVGADSGGSGTKNSDFSDLTKNRTESGEVGRLGGVSLQVNLSKDKSTWTVSETSAIYDNQTGQSITLINSMSLSVVLTAWCSSVEQQ